MRLPRSVLVSGRSSEAFDPHVRSLTEVEELARRAEVEGLTLARVVSRAWLQSRALARGRLEILSGEIIDLDSLTVRRDLERRYARELDAYGVSHLDMAELRSRSRSLTQLLARRLYEDGVAGVLYGSNLDNQPCVALFEHRTRLKAVTRGIPLSEKLPELSSVLLELGIIVSNF